MSSVTLFFFPVVFVSPLHWCRAHTHLYMSLSRTCVVICPTTVILSFFHSSGPACVMQKLRVSMSLDVIVRLLTDVETRRFGFILFHIGSGAEILGDVN